MKVVYGVKWIESEWGLRDEGWKLCFCDLRAWSQARIDSANGPYPNNSGYCGPVRPLMVQEIPWDCLEPNDQQALLEADNLFVFTRNHYTPKFMVRALENGD